MSPRNRIRSAISSVLSKLGRQPRRSYGLNELDLKLRPYLNFKNGFFVEAGANDGLTQSNTMYFERYHGWHGLLIEPIPELAAKCRENRPNAIVEECALVSSPTAQTIQIRYANLMSAVKGARGNSTAEALHFQGAEKFLPPDKIMYDIEVRGKTLQEVFDANRVEKVDLLSLDVEGYEAEALRGLDLNRIAPRYILVEANSPDEIAAVLSRRYNCVAQLSHHDRLYQLRD